MKKIPPAQIMDKTVTFMPDENLRSEADAFGLWIPDLFRIKLQTGQSENELQNTVIHELIHASLDILGYQNESRNEQLVTGLANCLRQAGVEKKGMK